MGMRARLERDLRACKTVWEGVNQVDPQNDYTARAFKKVQRRIHLLEFVLSGRYARLRREATLRTHGR